MRSEYYDCEPVPEGLARYANELDYTTADLQTDPDLRKRLEIEYEAQQKLRRPSMSNIRMYPVKQSLASNPGIPWEALRITGWCVEVAGTDACGEFHSGTNEENKANAEMFARALTEQGHNAH